jgi:membrane-bound lytic murein transglycosylase B
MTHPSGRRLGARRVALVVIVAVGVVGGALIVATLLPQTDLLGQRIPAVALDAYRSASRNASEIRPDCAVSWRILAAIGKVESDHGRLRGPRTIAADGVVTPVIRGPALDGTGGTQAIPDTDRGRLDGDPTWDRAVGPLQFIPTTWRELGRDGNGDRIADPDNLYDAALTAAAHLCIREPGDYGRRRDLRRALIGYNASASYAAEVLDWVDRYADRTLSELLAPGS